MSAKQTKDGWKVDFRVGGKDGKRYRKTCKTKSEAERYQKFVEAQHIAHGKPWNDKPADSRLLSELVELWAVHFGRKLISYKRRRQKLDNMVERLGNPIAAKLEAQHFSAYISARLEEGRKAATANESIKFLNSVYNGLKTLGVIDYDNPIKTIKHVKQRQTEMTFLSMVQINKLLDSLQGDCKLISEICLSTGARWGEAENLTITRVHDKKITYSDTKNGKNRTIPISLELYNKIKQHAEIKSPGHLFDDCYSDFQNGLETAEITLPKGQNTHVLRHSFASHFMINGGNILSLQKILGHSTIEMTMRYAHLAPDHLNDATQYNPISVNGHKMDDI